MVDCGGFQRVDGHYDNTTTKKHIKRARCSEGTNIVKSKEARNDQYGGSTYYVL